MIETPCGRQLGDEDGEALELRRRQARGRLVHGEDLGVLHHGARDLDDLALGDLEGADGCCRVDGRVERCQGLGGRLLLPAARHKQAACGFQRVAEEHVLRDGELGNVLEFLMDHRDPGATGRYRPVPGNTDAIDLHVPRRGIEDAGQDAQERRLAGAVLAEEPMHGAPLHRHVDAIERAHGSKALADIHQPQAIDCCIHWMITPSQEPFEAGRPGALGCRAGPRVSRRAATAGPCATRRPSRRRSRHCPW